MQSANYEENFQNSLDELYTLISSLTTNIIDCAGAELAINSQTNLMALDQKDIIRLNLALKESNSSKDSLKELLKDLDPEDSGLIQSTLESIEQDIANYILRLEEKGKVLLQEQKRLEERNHEYEKSIETRNAKVLELIQLIQGFINNIENLSLEAIVALLVQLRIIHDIPSEYIDRLASNVELLKSSAVSRFPQLEKFDLDSNQEAKRKRNQKIFPYFYQNDIIAKGVYQGKFQKDDYLVSDIFRQLRNGKLMDALSKAYENYRENKIFEPNPINLFKDEAALPNSEVYTEYFSKHSPEYLSKLDKLIYKSGFTKEWLSGKKTIIAIPAMNEIGLTDVVNSFKQSYAGDFDREVGIVIYHNSKNLKGITVPVRNAIEVVKKLPNVLVMEEEVPIFNTTGMAKKTVSDIAMRMQGESLDLPLVMADADVMQVSTGLIESSITSLEKPEILASSPEFDYGEVYKKQYPVLGLIWEIRRKIAIEKTITQKNGGTHMTYGMFYAIKSRTLAMIGGIKPSEQFEDKNVTTELKDSISFFTQTEINQNAQSPIAPLNVFGHVVYINPDREITDLRKGNLQWSRWLNERTHQEISGTVRGESDTSLDATIPELGNLTAENLMQALNRSIPFLLPQITALSFAEGESELSWQSRELLKQLKSYNIKPIKVKIVIMEGITIEIANEDRLNELMNSNTPFIIESFEEITM